MHFPLSPAGEEPVEDKIPICEAQQRMLNLMATEAGPGLNLAERAQVKTRVGLVEIFRHP